jgi:glycosyltransferase involved in cell wall biosynthesis
LIEQKGLVYLLKACRILKEQGCRFNCRVIGGAEEPLYTRYFDNLKQLHEDLALEDCVFFVGAQSFGKVLESYRTADVFVLPCVVAEDGSRDITPNALMEAMAMRLPVVSTTVTAIPEIVDDGISGLLVPPGDERVLGAAVIRLSKDPLLRHRLGKNARSKIEAQFDITRNIEKLVHLFARGCE